MEYKSRWGYHPCDWATFDKLRKLNAALERACHLIAAWNRWERKDPHNRVMRKKIRNAQGQIVGYQPPEPLEEPTLCPVFCEKYQETTRWTKNGYVKEPVTLDRVRLLYREVATDCRKARRPMKAPEEVQPLTLSLERIDFLLAQLK